MLVRYINLSWSTRPDLNWRINGLQPFALNQTSPLVQTLERIIGFEPIRIGWKPTMLPLNIISAFGANEENRTPVCGLAIHGTASIPHSL